MIVRHCALSLLASLGAVACGMRGDAASVDSTELTSRAARIAQRLSDSTSGAARGVPIARWWLPTTLNEVSGLTMTSDGRLLAHGDEYGSVAVLDPRRGVLLKEFSIGAKADFEGITIADGVIYMLASNGDIYVFREGANRERVRYELLDTRLGRECEFEGIAFDHVRRALLLPCKNVQKKSLRGNLVIYVWQLAPVTPRLSVLAIPLRRVIGDNSWADLRPTDIAVDPKTGHYLLVAASERALVELTPNGQLVHAMPLPGREHAQAEGIAITEDGILIIADEATSRFASITLYRWPLNEGPAGTP